MKYLKSFENHNQYDTFTGTSEFMLPNVSICKKENDTHYTPLIKVSGVTLNNTELSLQQGNTDALVASVLPYNASYKNVTWSSSNNSIATVDDNGVVSGISVGNADITVTTEDGGFTDTCELKVKSNKAIKYFAIEKIPESTSYYDGGIHINSFSGTGGQKLTMVSHTFEDGVGIVTFNGNISKIGNRSFYSCSGLTSIEIPDSVTSIGESAFDSCRSITSCTIGSGVTNIENNVFRYCSSLTSIVIPGSVKSIGNGVFYGCSGLKSVNIPSGVTSISQGTFYNCTSLTSIEIPDNVTSIGDSAFAYCTGLTSIYIPSSITSISDYLFYYCSGLTSVVIPDSITSIGERAFISCSSLKNIVIPNSVRSIGEYAFAACYGVTSCTIGSGVTYIEQYAFSNCGSLTSIIMAKKSAPSIQNNTFYSIKSNGVLYVPIGSGGYDSWMNKNPWYLGHYNWTKVEQ